ncbi:Ulp1 family isopeptidase [Bradyrhizobium japonicum]|uniref:Ulp1 family isopeptidase n=1 Tax=Bradyrhizobium japonicum TaxID=375 RepID=UPI0027146A91|nr:Ulp1 family isopeptidase [Bradyrhizobium japonicum]WLB24708.1 Ulp1 family isopeptidase [Bradyrhizobium japonicum]
MDGGFFPSAGAGNSWYHEQVAQQSENVPADQASVEEQPDGLQLSASDEPETSPEQARGVRRVDVGSMRQTLQSDLQSGRFISGRDSVDFPGASFAYPAGVPQSSLRAEGFGSMRYTAPSENASVPKTKHSWLSRASSKLKSGLRSIGGGGPKNTSGPSNEQEIVWANLNHEDAELIEWYQDQMSHAGHGQARSYTSALRRLSRELAANGQLPFARRLHDPALDAEAKALGDRELAALNSLRKLKGVPKTKMEHSEDAELIEWYQDQISHAGHGQATRYTSALRRLSRELAANGQLPFARRLHDPALDAEAKALGDGELAALNSLRKLKGVPKTNLNHEDAELIEWYQDQMSHAGHPQARQYASLLRGLSRALAEKGQPPFAGRLDDPALDAEARTVHCNTITGLNSLRKLMGVATRKLKGVATRRLNPDPIYSQDEDLIQRFQRACTQGLEFRDLTAYNYSNRLRMLSRWCFANNRGAIADRLNDSSLFDDADAVPQGRNFKPALRALQRVQDQLLVQQQSVDLPPRFASQRRSEVVSPIDLLSSPEEQQVDLSRQGPSGLSLGPEEWLGDEHILADFTLLRHELERDNPILRGQTRFVDPLIAHQLRVGADDVRESALQHVLYDRYGNDTAEFLFLPVIDASKTSRGTHWSLLLVDRRDRQRPVAYHYDSFGGRNDNDAAMLADRLNASHYPASIGQQQNGYDCGVFVVDGTRELVRRLAEDWEPNLWNLNNVVANRKRLQRRLSTAPGNARANDPAYQAGRSTRSDDSTEFWREVDQAGQPATDSWNTANFWQGLPFGHSPAQTVDQPGSFNSTAFWQGVDRAGQPATDSWNTANFWQGVQAPFELNALRRSPSAQSVNQPSPPPWEQNAAESIFGATAHMPPPPSSHWQAGSSQQLPATPATPSAGAWAWLGQQMQEPASPSSVRPRSSNIYGGLDSFVDLDPPTPHDLRDDACSAPAPSLYRPRPIVPAAQSGEGPVDLGYLIRGGWEHRDRFLPPYLVRALEGQGIMPQAGQPTYFEIRGVPYKGELVESEGRQRVRAYPNPR